MVCEIRWVCDTKHVRVTGNNQTCAVLRLSPTLWPPRKACDTPANTCPRTFPTWSGFLQLGGFQLVRGFLNRIIHCGNTTYVGQFNRKPWITIKRGRSRWYVTWCVTSSAHFLSSPTASAPCFVPSKILLVVHHFVFIIHENAKFSVLAFPWANMQSLSKMDLTAHPWLGPGYSQILGTYTKLLEFFQCTCYCMFTAFFALQREIWKVVCCKGLKISQKSTHKWA